MTKCTKEVKRVIDYIMFEIEHTGSAVSRIPRPSESETGEHYYEVITGNRERVKHFGPYKTVSELDSLGAMVENTLNALKIL